MRGTWFRSKVRGRTCTLHAIASVTRVPQGTNSGLLCKTANSLNYRSQPLRLWFTSGARFQSMSHLIDGSWQLRVSITISSFCRNPNCASFTCDCSCASLAWLVSGLDPQAFGLLPSCCLSLQRSATTLTTTCYERDLH